MKMVWNFSLYSWSLMAAAVLLGWLAFMGWRRRPVTGAESFAYLQLALAWWALVTVFESAVPGIAGKLFWSKLQYFGVVSVAPLWLLFALDYTGQSHLVTRKTLTFIWGPSALTLVLALTNEWHHLIWQDVTLLPGSGLALYEHGKWFWLAVTYFYILIALGTLAILWAILRFPQAYRAQATALVTGVVMPWIGNILYVSDLLPVRGLDPTPFAFGVTGLIYIFSLFKQQFLNLAPIARDVLVDGMSDAVLVLDTRGRVVDLNPAAKRLVRIGSYTPGSAVEDVFRHLPGLLTFCKDGIHDNNFLALPPDRGAGSKAERFFDARRTVLRERDGSTTGQLIVLREVTSQHWAQRQLEKAHEQLTVQMAEIQTLQIQLREQASRDPLTGLYNRRYLEDSWDRDVALAHRTGNGLSLVILDIDHFKRINDTYGHAGGDLMLQEMGHILKAHTRSSDIACRFGGEEFVVVMPGTSIETAMRRAEQWRSSFQDTALNFEDQVMSTTISLGVGHLPTHGKTMDQLLRVADKALYRAKHSGRNRIVIAEAEKAAGSR